MNRILKNYFYNLCYQLVALFVPLLTAPYLARVLGADGTGVYGYVHSLTALICSVVMLGIYGYGNRQIAYTRDNPDDLNNAFWRIMSSRLILGIFGSLIFAVIVLFFGRYQVYFLIYYTYLLGYFLDCTWLFVGVEDMKWAVLKNTFMKVIALTGIFLFVKSKNDVGNYIFIQGSSILFANLAAYTQLGRYISRPKLDFSHVKEDLLGSLQLFLPGVAHTFYLQCDKIMLEIMTSATKQVAYYDYAEKIVTIPLSFITVLSTVMMPRIANEFKKEHYSSISALLNNAARASLFMAFPLMFGMLSISEKMIPWYLGDEFLPTISAICIISPIIVTNTLTGISGGQFFTATNQIRILLKAQIIAAAANIIINAILIPRYGYIGAAIATVLSSVLCAVIQYWHLTKQIELPGLFLVGIKYFCMGGTMFAIIWLTSRNLAPTVLTSLTQIFIGLVSYFFMGFLFKDEQMLFFIRTIGELVNRRKSI